MLAWQDYVKESDVLIILQSAGVLGRPYCLLELMTAIEVATVSCIPPPPGALFPLPTSSGSPLPNFSLPH